MVVNVRKSMRVINKLPYDVLVNQYNINAFFKLSNRYIAISNSNIIRGDITHVRIIERHKTKPYKQCMDLSMGRIPKMYTETEEMHRVYRLKDEQAMKHTYEVYDIM